MLNRLLFVLTILLLCYTLVIGSVRENRICQYEYEHRNGCVPVLFDPPQKFSLPTIKV